MGWTRRAAALGLCGGAVVAAACSAFEDDTTPLEPEFPDASAAASDASAPDGATAAADAAPTGWIPCRERTETPQRFCDDFDDKPEVTARWPGAITTNDGGIGASTAARSLPRAATFTLPSSGGTTASARLVRPAGVDFLGSSRVALGFAIRIDAPPYAQLPTSGGYTTLATLQFDDALCNTTPAGKERSAAIIAYAPNRLKLAAKGFRADCVDAGDDYLDADLETLVTELAAFERLAIVVTKTPCTPEAGHPAYAYVDVGGVPRGCIPLGVDPFARAKKASISVGLLSGGGPFAASRATFDDVTLELD